MMQIPISPPTAKEIAQSKKIAKSLGHPYRIFGGKPPTHDEVLRVCVSTKRAYDAAASESLKHRKVTLPTCRVSKGLLDQAERAYNANMRPMRYFSCYFQWAKAKKKWRMTWSGLFSPSWENADLADFGTSPNGNALDALAVFQSDIRFIDGFVRKIRIKRADLDEYASEPAARAYSQLAAACHPDPQIKEQAKDWCKHYGASLVIPHPHSLTIRYMHYFYG